MQISKRTRFKFGEFATAHSVLREIDHVFMAEDFEHVENWQELASAMRRSLVAVYHAAVDFSDPAQVGRLVRIYADAINSWGRDEKGELVADANDLIRSLRRDGVPIDDEGELTTSVVALNVPLSDFHRLGDPRVVQQHLERISVNVERDPAAAVGSAKELVESVCKFILDDYRISYDKQESLLDLYKKAAKALKLNRESVPDSVKGSESAQRVRFPLLRVTVPSQPEQLPFARYRGGGRTLLQPPPMGDGSSRHGYGVPVFAECGSACAYCGRDLGSAYDSWLDLSVDHVIPSNTIKLLGYPQEWVNDLINLVSACRSWNEFLNGYRVTDPAPADLEGFCESRDRHFLLKREWVMARHEREREKYDAWRAASAPA